MALGLVALGFQLVCQNAFAGEWYAATIDGQGGSNGRVSSQMIPCGTIPTGGNGFYVYAIANNTGTIYEGWYASGDWHYISIYASADLPALMASASFVNTFHVAHIDWDRRVRLTSWSLFPGGWITRDVDGDGQGVLGNLSDVSTVAFKGKLHIFYREFNQPGGPKNALRAAIFDGTNFTFQQIDGTGNFAEPTAVAATDGLRVYYYDEDNGTLHEAFSPDGVNWTSFHTLDGPAGLGGDRADVGHHPSAIVFNGTVNVFYEDRTNGWLRLAQLNYATGWHFGWVQPMDIGSYSAAVIHNGAMQVYYTLGGQLRGAWGTVPNGFQSLPIDGPGGIAKYSSSDHMYTPVAALEVNSTAPSVFYEDSGGGVLRNAYWVP
jgi:hypothetical protein